jgi:hypothetical protein
MNVKMSQEGFEVIGWRGNDWMGKKSDRGKDHKGKLLECQPLLQWPPGLSKPEETDSLPFQ